MSQNTLPYTYLIGWSELNKFYYGVRYANNCHPTDFWIKYFTSSKLVEEYRLEHGEPDIIQIRQFFKTKEDALKWERKVLIKLNVTKNDKWLNQSISGEKFTNKGIPRSPECRAKISQKARERAANKTPEQRLEDSLRAKEVGNRPENKEKLRQKAIERFADDEFKQKYLEQRGSDEFRQKMQENKQRQLANPNYVAKMKEITSSTEYREKISKANLKRFSNTDARKKISDKMKEICQSEGYLEGMSKRGKEAYMKHKDDLNASYFKKK